MSRLVAYVLIAIFCLWGPDSPARAQVQTCTALQTITAADLEGYNLDQIQLGVRTALGQEDRGLVDGDLGPITRNALRQLCESNDFISADPANDMAETLDLARDYGALAEIVETWPSALATIDGLIQTGEERQNLTLLRLAGPPQLTAGVLTEISRTLCEDIDVGGMAASARPALDALLRDRSSQELCAALSVVGPAITPEKVLTELSALQTEYDAVEILQSTAFATWLAEDLQPRLIQLAGSNAAVIDLLDRFEIERPRETVFLTPVPESCKIIPDRTTTRYFSFGEKELEILANSVDVAALLAPLIEAEGSRSAESLWQKMEPLLIDTLDACGVDRIEALVLGPARLGLGYQLDAERVAGFKLSPDLIDSEPILAPLVELRVPEQEDLLAGLRANLTRALTESLNGQIEVAADLLAGAAEEVQESLDVARVDPENFDEVELPPLLGITDPSVKAALDTITNEAFKRAIFEGPFIVGTNDEILKAEVRNLLRPLIADQVAQAVEEDVNLIRSAIRSDWRVTQRMLDAIAELPEVARVEGDGTGARLSERMQKLIGLEYPNESLFRAALRDIDPVSEQATGNPLSDALEQRAIGIAQKVVDDPDSTRVTAPLALPDCGCVPPKVTPEGNEVYTFYPFWFAPLEETEEDEGTETEAEGAEEADPDTPALPELIDYSFASRVAFYGMEFDFEFPDAGADKRNLRLKYLNHWLNMRRDFINSAHQHRAKVDVSFDMRNWRDWSELEQTYAVDRIVQYTAPIPRLRERSFAAFWEAVPTLFDPMQPDGVTLVFEDYTGDPATDIDVSTLVRLVERVEESLAERGQTVNLAFNLKFMDVGGREGLLDDLRELLTKGNDGDKPVDKVLVFLERPTTLTKKLLRQRLDFGEFRGAERATVARNLLPVLPAAAHKDVTQRPRSNDEGQIRAEPFSQFADDLIYFAKDFAGVGFWPLPQQEGPETPDLQQITLGLWQAELLPPRLQALAPDINQFCTWACPQRAAISLVTMAVFTVLAGLVGFSYYSGTIDKIAFKWYSVHISVLFVLAALLVLTTCDPAGVAPPILLIAFLVFLAGLFAADFIQRMRNGPKP